MCQFFWDREFSMDKSFCKENVYMDRKIQKTESTSDKNLRYFKNKPGMDY